MAELNFHTDVSVDFSSIPDPQVRRALRAMCQQMSDTIARQQQQIEALLAMMVDKNIASTGEFRRLVMRMQQKAGVTPRVRDAVNAPVTPVPTAAAHSPASTKPRVLTDHEDDPDTNRPRVYKL
jgi:hypothetical protein